MNRKGFTLIELLAVIVVLALVLVIAIPTSIDAYKKARLKTEDVFVKRLSEVINDYTSLATQDLLKNGDKLQFSSLPGTFEKDDGGIISMTSNENYNVYETTITVNDLISNDLLFEAKYINPNNKDYKYTTLGVTKNTCNPDAVIKIYKDSDSVYCHKIRFDSLGCLTDDYKNLIRKEQNLEEGTDDYKNPYVVDTCLWKKK